VSRCKGSFDFVITSPRVVIITLRMTRLRRLRAAGVKS
jgi:hypothetical protein